MPQQPQDTVRGSMRYRPLGKTGVEISALGLGGFHVGTQKDEQESIRLIRSAIDRGITFLDNCWDYNEGQSELRMGKALKDGYRDKAFLMTKVDGRTKKAAAEQIDESLKRLQVERVDLMQYHEVIRLEDPDRIFAEGGAVEAFRAARQAGKIRFVGFTGHKDPLVHLRMLEVADQHGYTFDTVQLPLNVFDYHFRSFEAKVLPELTRRGIGVLGMKSMGNPFLLKSGVVTPTECLHYALNLPAATVITGIDSMEILEQDLEAVRTFQPLSAERLNELRAKAAPKAVTGQFEPFKTSALFDATATHPHWLGDSGM